jgi:glycosyltransferase involved in cell wall biosynthesis
MGSRLNTVLHISSPLSWRGGEQQLYYLYKGLKEDKTANFAQKVFCPIGSELSSKIDTKDCIIYKKRGGFDILAAKRLAKICRKQAITFLHAHDAHSHTTAVLSAMLFNNATPIILSRRVDFAVGKNWWSRMKYNHNSIQRIVCVSEAINTIVQKGTSLNSSKVVTIHSGIDPNKFVKMRSGHLRNELGCKPDEILIGNIAALADHKDYFTFIDTVFLLHNKHPSWKFVVIGNGPMELELKQYADQKGLHKVIHFVGYRTDVQQIFKDLDVLLFTSKTEGLGTTVLDAFGNQVPVVATNAGGISEMVEDGQTGLLAEVGDAKDLANKVEQVLQNAELNGKIVAGANQKLKLFTNEVMINKTRALYSELLLDTNAKSAE